MSETRNTGINGNSLKQNITCELLWCFIQLFGLSFWRHPFTAEDPLVSKWCNAKLLQICSDEEIDWFHRVRKRKKERKNTSYASVLPLTLLVLDLPLNLQLQVGQKCPMKTHDSLNSHSIVLSVLYITCFVLYG